MSKSKLTPDERTKELKKLRDVFIFSTDYLFELMAEVKINEYDLTPHRQSIIEEAEDFYKKGKLTLLKRWCNSMTELFRQEKDLDFEHALKTKTGIEIGIAGWYRKNFDRIIENKKMKSIEDYGWTKTFLRFKNHHLALDKNKISLLKAFAEEYETKLRKKGLIK